ncbi:MAG: class I SAM-dependent methyltransferase [Candidatus Dormibacterales bacterium]
MESPELRVTRGHGLLEGFLARQRARRANSLIPETARSGRILDVGCGSYPAFLLNTRFEARYGVDRVALPGIHDAQVTLVEQDIAGDAGLPFDDSFFEVVTMLAVFEHIETRPLGRLLREVRRVLQPGGTYVMTTPVRWTEGILKLMSHLNLVSREEVGEHKAQYSPGEIVALLLEAGFERSDIRLGTFELGMNLWAAAKKGG